MVAVPVRDNPPDADGHIRNYLDQDGNHVPPLEVQQGKWEILSQASEYGRGLPRTNYTVHRKES
jgi:hypothetical protein